MKKTFHFIMFIALSIMSIMFLSCSKNDDVDLGSFDYPTSELFGTWKASVIHANGRWIVVSDYPQYSMSITFNDDGTFKGEGYLGYGSGTFKLNGKTITTYVDGKLYATYYVSSYKEGVAEFTITIGKESLSMHAYNVYYKGSHSGSVTPPPFVNP